MLVFLTSAAFPAFRVETLTFVATPDTLSSAAATRPLGSARDMRRVLPAATEKDARAPIFPEESTSEPLHTEPAAP